MLYYFFKFLHENYDLPGSGLYQFITFRAIAAAILSLLIGTIFGKKVIRFLQKKQIGETVRDLGLQGENLKAGTPTMGGIIILLAILIPVLLFAKIENIYILLLLATSIWLGIIGFADDYIKVFLKDKKGLRGRAKVVGQIGLGLIIGLVMYWHKDVRIREFEYNAQAPFSYEALIHAPYKDIKSLKTTIPFFKENEFDYRYLVPDSLGETGDLILYLIVVTFIITAVSNGANITDGLDGLAAGTSAIIGVTLGVLAYVSGNVLIANYLNIMYLPNTGEILVFCMAFVGACIAFLWYNSFPAQVFMGDTGSLALGGIIATLAIVLRKELMIPMICGIFLVENLSVMLQVSYFKYTKKKYGEGRRIFLMSPLHHHYQKKGYHEAKIVARFWIVGIMLAILAIATLKIR
ncbi:phospho-N-acetylmuramoyl-pentapeptide-transferase [Hugenholtzia roseola]|uniref:phospho-N-acetylmuramoyl-pentapeptide- transferase n=1 Tax=Hugenholtzia roseola TaxID=1002 RepID=UPI00042580C9|nr:phospho-N-acetylmuramoyl-pentapeptide-transferase [Hugenholtzia roseola]